MSKHPVPLAAFSGTSWMTPPVLNDVAAFQSEEICQCGRDWPGRNRFMSAVGKASYDASNPGGWAWSGEGEPVGDCRSRSCGVPPAFSYRVRAGTFPAAVNRNIFDAPRPCRGSQERLQHPQPILRRREESATSISCRYAIDLPSGQIITQHQPPLRHLRRPRTPAFQDEPGKRQHHPECGGTRRTAC